MILTILAIKKKIEIVLKKFKKHKTIFYPEEGSWKFAEYATDKEHII